MEPKLEESLVEYFEALTVFHEDPNRFKSFCIPEASRKVFDRFFKARQDLFNIAISSDNLIAQAWAEAHKNAEECPQLMLDHKHGEAAHRMEVLGKAETQLYAMLREKQNETF